VIGSIIDELSRLIERELGGIFLGEESPWRSVENAQAALSVCCFPTDRSHGGVFFCELIEDPRGNNRMLFIWLNHGRPTYNDLTGDVYPRCDLTNGAKDLPDPK
jgi:hypothetical protein